MEQAAFSSPVIAKKMQRVFGSNTQVVKIEMRHEDDVKKYVMRIENHTKFFLKLQYSKIKSPYMNISEAFNRSPIDENEKAKQPANHPKLRLF